MELAEQYGVKADVSNEQSLQSAFDRAKSALGKLDGIAIATWIAIDKPLVSQGWEEVNKLFQVNNMSKGGVRMVSKALSAELAPSGICANSISPAFIKTDQTKTARDHTTVAAGDLMQTAPPPGRIGRPEEVSGAAVYLLSDAAAYTTAADILISGGIHTGRGGDYDTC